MLTSASLKASGSSPAPIPGRLFSIYTRFLSDLLQAQGLHTSSRPLPTVSFLSLPQPSVPNSGLLYPPAQWISPAAACHILPDGDDTRSCLPVRPPLLRLPPSSRLRHALTLWGLQDPLSALNTLFPDTVLVHLLTAVKSRFKAQPPSEAHP